jgi:hypothetical protein
MKAVTMGYSSVMNYPPSINYRARGDFESFAVKLIGVIRLVVEDPVLSC